MDSLRPAMLHAGRCHCGAIGIEFETEQVLAPRACQCDFCRRHGARTVTDPEGRATLSLPAELTRYRFGSRSSDYLLCGRCGIYVGAVAEIDGQLYATLNLNAFEDPLRELEATPVSYDGEDKMARSKRRSRRWTPALVVPR